MVAQIGLTDKHTTISHWTQSCCSYTLLFHGLHISSIFVWEATVQSQLQLATIQEIQRSYFVAFILDGSQEMMVGGFEAGVEAADSAEQHLRVHPNR